MTAVPVEHRRARLTVAYDGAPYHGFSESEGVRTVLGEIRDAMQRVVGEALNPIGAGRTDTGVHGWGQVISVDLPAHLDVADIARRVSLMCGPSITIREAAWVDDPTFHARFSASWRHYRYDVWNSPRANPFVAATSWHVTHPLDLWAMRLGCDPLIGEHDFSSFCRKPKDSDDDRQVSMARRVMLARWTEVDSDYGVGLLRFEIRANAFCHQMVRAIVGTLVDVGTGKRSAGDMRALLLSRDRTNSSRVAPARGLCLWEVGYPDVTSVAAGDSA